MSSLICSIFNQNEIEISVSIAGNYQPLFCNHVTLKKKHVSDCKRILFDS